MSKTKENINSPTSLEMEILADLLPAITDSNGMANVHDLQRIMIEAELEAYRRTEMMQSHSSESKAYEEESRRIESIEKSIYVKI